MALQLPAEHQATSGEDFVATQGSVTLVANARQASVQIVIKQVRAGGSKPCTVRKRLRGGVNEIKNELTNGWMGDLLDVWMN